MADGGSVQSLERAFGLIELLSQKAEGMQLVEICRSTGLHKSTAHRLLMSMASLGYVRKDEGSGRYCLTMKLFELSGRLVNSLDVHSAAKGPVDRLRDATQEAVHLVIREGKDIVYIYKADSAQNSIQMVSRIGMRRPLYSTAVGKCILASLSNEEVAQIWQQSEIVRYTPGTIVELEGFLWELDTVRRLGYAMDREENELGVKCIAVPIRDYTGAVISAISVSAPVMRMPDDRVEELVPLVLQTGGEISAALGYGA